MNPLQIITDNYSLLSHDFMGININLWGIGFFFVHILLAGMLFLFYYLFGEKLRKIFFHRIASYHFFINIALGYISIGTGMAMLGTLGLLKPYIIASYLLCLFSFALYPYRVKRFDLRSLFEKNSKSVRAIPKFVLLGVLAFVLISFLRLMTPEIVEDGYHTDLPRMYLQTQTMMHESKEMLHVIPYPQLAEMTYIIPLFLGDKEATRFIHFGFYLLIILLLFTISQEKKNAFMAFAPLLFVTAPLSIRYAPSQYVDFFMILAFLLTVLLLVKIISLRQAVLAGLCFGAVISTKMWMLIYLPTLLLFLVVMHRKLLKKRILSLTIVFTLSAFFIVLVWYIRSYLLTGNFIYPIFTKIEYLESSSVSPSSTLSYFGFNSNMFAYQNMVVLSGLFFLGILYCLLFFSKFFPAVKQNPLFIFFVILTIEQLVIKVDLGRYLFAWYTTTIIIVSAGINLAWKRSKFAKYGLAILVVGLAIYYLVNTLLTLPYGWRWANKNAYLTTVLGRDNVSYYDFEKKFDKHITKSDLVATYGIGSFYYADFPYIDVGYVFAINDRDFNNLKEKKVTKLLIKGGDLQWFCDRIALKNCNEKKVSLLATYPSDIKKYNLYKIK